MRIIFNFPAFAILISLLCSGIGFAIKDGRKAKYFSLALLTVCLLMNGAVLYRCIAQGAFTYTMGHYPAPWGNEIRADIWEGLIAVTFEIVLILSVIGGGKELELDIPKDKLNLYFVMLNLVNASLLALVYTNDIFTGYVFIEICTIASAGLLMIKNIGRTLLAATRYMIFSLLGSGLFLIGVILLYDITGHLLMPNILEAVQALWASGEYRLPLLVVMGLISVGLAIKSGLFPFHFWMPDTYGYASAASSGILSGVVSKGYIFLLIKIIFRCFGTETFYGSGINNVLYIFGICGMIFGSMEAIRENEINRMTAFSSAAQIGYIYMGIGLSAGPGICAALFHTVAHAITKPVIFLANHSLSLVSDDSKKFHDLRGAGLRNKSAGVIFALSAFSLVGIPGLMGFVSKLLFAQAAIHGRLKLVLTLIALALSTILNTMYLLRTVITIYSVKTSETERDTKIRTRQQMGFVAAGVFLIAVNVCIGVHFRPILSLIEMGL